MRHEVEKRIPVLFEIYLIQFPCFFYHLKNSKHLVLVYLINAGSDFYRVKEALTLILSISKGLVSI